MGVLGAWGWIPVTIFSYTHILDGSYVLIQALLIYANLGGLLGYWT